MFVLADSTTVAEFAFAGIGPALRIVTLVFLFAFVLGILFALIRIAALPGSIAAKRHHPQATAINICGWFGLPTGFFWVVAIVWAFVKQADASTSGSAAAADLQQRLSTLESKLTELEDAMRGKPI